MSLSINHSPLFNGDTTSMERLSPSMSKTFTQTGTLGANTTVAHPGVPHDPFKVSNSNMTIETGGLARLLDMLEQVVKESRTLDVDVVVIDEAQDLSRLQNDARAPRAASCSDPCSAALRTSPSAAVQTSRRCW